jgi:Protein of unknown function (DUF3108)
MKILRLLAVISIFSLVPCHSLPVRSAAASDEAGPSSSSGRAVTCDKGGVADAGGAGDSSHSLSGHGKRNTGLLRDAKEKLYFDIYWMGIYVGNATLEGVNRGGRLTITSEVHSAPVISVLYKVEDHASSTVVDGRPVEFRIRQREGRYRSDKETLFDRAGRKITYIDYRKGIRAEHEVNKGPVWDVISGFYYLRTLLLQAGKTLSLNVFDSNKMLKTEVHVLRKEKIAFPGKGKVDAFVVKPVLRTEGLFKHKGDMLIWLTGDESRVPVRVETRVSIGKVVAELKRIEIAR